MSSPHRFAILELTAFREIGDRSCIHAFFDPRQTPVDFRLHIADNYSVNAKHTGEEFRKVLFFLCNRERQP